MAESITMQAHLRSSDAFRLAGREAEAVDQALAALDAVLTYHRLQAAEKPAISDLQAGVHSLGGFLPSPQVISLTLIARADTTLDSLITLLPIDAARAVLDKPGLVVWPAIWRVALFALAGASETAITLAHRLDQAVTPKTYGRNHSLPHLGATLTAILQGDADQANILFLQALDAHERSRKRGYARNTTQWSFELAILYRLAQRHNITLEVPERIHHVQLTYSVAYTDFHHQGEHIPFRTKFTHPTDLLPTTFFDAVADAYSARSG